MTLPLVFSTLVAGTAVDFFGRRRISLVSDSLSGTAVAAVPLTAWSFGADAINLVELAVLAFFAAAFDPAGTTARQSMLPEAAARAGWSLDRTNSIYEAILNLAYIVGPGIGGLMIATVGGINTMWITAGCFGLSFLRDRGAAARGRRQAAPRDPTRRVGVRHRRRPAIRLEPAGATDARADRPGRHRAVPADGKRAVSRSTSPTGTNPRSWVGR